MSCRVALPLVGGPADVTYWPAIPLLAVVLGCAALPFAALATPAELATGEAIALLLLLWPAAATAIRRIADRRTRGWMSLPFYFACLVGFMMAFFGKPLQMGSLPFAGLVPLVMLLFLAAWLLVDILTLPAQTVAEEAVATA